MATAVSEFEGRDVSIGRIFNRAFGTLGSNPVATIGIALLFGALPGTLIAYGSQRLNTLNVGGISPSQVVAITLAGVVLGIVFWTITQGALVRATVAHSEGRESSLGESVAAGLKVALPLVLLAIVSAIGVGLAMLLLIIPGIIVYVMWAVAAPALVEERLDALEALGRSAELTAGARWKIFGLELILLIGTWMFSAAVAGVLLGVFGLQGVSAMAQSGEFPLVYFGVNAITQTVTTAVWGVVQTSLYVELRNWKDGPPADALVDVFG